MSTSVSVWASVGRGVIFTATASVRGSAGRTPLPSPICPLVSLSTYTLVPLPLPPSLTSSTRRSKPAEETRGILSIATHARGRCGAFPRIPYKRVSMATKVLPEQAGEDMRHGGRDMRYRRDIIHESWESNRGELALEEPTLSLYRHTLQSSPLSSTSIPIQYPVHQHPPALGQSRPACTSPSTTHSYARTLYCSVVKLVPELTFDQPRCLAVSTAKPAQETKLRNS